MSGFGNYYPGGVDVSRFYQEEPMQYIVEMRVSGDDDNGTWERIESFDSLSDAESCAADLGKDVRIRFYGVGGWKTI